MIKQKSILKKAFTLETYDKDKKLDDAELEILKRNMGIDDSGKDLFSIFHFLVLSGIYTSFLVAF